MGQTKDPAPESEELIGHLPAFQGKKVLDMEYNDKKKAWTVVEPKE